MESPRRPAGCFQPPEAPAPAPGAPTAGQGPGFPRARGLGPEPHFTFQSWVTSAQRTQRIPVYLQNIKKSVNHLHINPPFCHFVHALVWKKIKTFFKKRKQMITRWERAISTLCQQAWSPGPCWARAPRSLGSVQAAAGRRAGGRGPTVLDIKHRRRSAKGGVCRPTGRNDFVHHGPAARAEGRGRAAGGRGLQ